ncbi:Os11g0527701 [Oryza sativa Japonica Group]|uniref:Os11g0527701 protein n=1 Tax=Oryza sativa subsp. japonica TaxID=39947 RepID=A0A0N7KT03_ORYSJ|nr:Os11g0527701 [Oryza sativa Japonica Group]
MHKMCAATARQAPGAHAPPVLVVVLLMRPHHPCRLRRRVAQAAQPIGDGGTALRLAADVVPSAGGAAGARPPLGIGDGGGRDEEVDLAGSSFDSGDTMCIRPTAPCCDEHCRLSTWLGCAASTSPADTARPYASMRPARPRASLRIGGAAGEETRRGEAAAQLLGGGTGEARRGGWNREAASAMQFGGQRRCRCHFSSRLLALAR